MPRSQAVGLILVALVLGFVIGFKSGKTSTPAVQEGATCSTPPPTDGANTPAAPPAAVTSNQPPSGLPRLVDLGSTTCLPCKQLAPILAEMKTEFRGKVSVEFIDVTKNVPAADQYKINVIPTQIFFDKDGKEVFRHEGFYPKADILAQLAKMGVQVK